MPVKIVTDSTSDISRSLAEEAGVIVVPQNVHFGQEVFRDGVDISGDEFYPRLMRGGTFPTTSQASVGAFVKIYAELAEAGYDVLSIHISSKLSGTYNSARLGSQEVKKATRIEIIDSLQVSMGLGLTVLAVAKAVKGGASMEQAIELARDIGNRVEQYALCDTLEYLQKGGRISRFQAFFGTLLSVKPLIKVEEGEAHPLERPRTRARGIERLLEQARAAGKIEDLCVLYTTVHQDADDLTSKLSALFPKERARIVQFGPAMGVHLGPGALGLAFIRAK